MRRREGSGVAPVENEAPGAGEALFFSETLVPVSAVALGLFLLLCVLRLHGFSLPAWHSLIDHSQPEEILLGEPRWIRTDDWVVVLPLLFAQDAQEPKFPAVSDLIGYGGADTLVGYSVPVRSWVSFFRPQVWGYFVGRDFGMAWQWWFRVFLLWYATLLALLLVTRGRTWIAWIASVAIVFSPFFQFWAFNCEPIAAMALLCFVSAAGVAFARTGGSLLLWGALLAWAGGCFGLSFVYPPFQIALAWLLVFLVCGYLVRERDRLGAAGRIKSRLGIAAVAVAVAGAALALYVAQNREALRIVAETVYPGHRVSSGGEVPGAQLFSSFFTAFLGREWRGVFQNVSETGSFFLFFPLTCASVVWEWTVKRRRPDAVFVSLALFCLLGSVYAVAGFPAGLAQLLFGGRVPGPRMVIGLGIADTMMLAVYLSSRPQEGRRALDRAIPPALALAWAAGMCAVGFAVASRVKDAAGAGVVLVALAVLALAVPIALRRRAAFAVLAAASVAATLGFNPLVRGGSEFLVTNPFSRKVLELDRQGGGRTRWVVYEAPELANLFRVLGVRAINGTHYYPQRALWSRLGATETGPEVRDLFNRYANVSFQVPRERRGPEMRLVNEDALLVSLHPDDPAFARLDLDYLVYVGPDHVALDDATRLSWVASVGDKHIFRVLHDNGPNRASVPAASGGADHAGVGAAPGASPPDAAAQYQLGNSLFGAGRLDEAIEHYREAVRLAPDRAEVHNNLGNALATRGDTAEAMEQYLQALRLDPGFAEAHNNLGAALVRQGRVEEAIAQYEAALRLVPEYAEAANNLGLALAGAGRFPEAIASYERALRIHPYYAEAHNNLGVALAHVDRLPEALEHFRQAVRINPDFREARANLDGVQEALRRKP